MRMFCWKTAKSDTGLDIVQYLRNSKSGKQTHVRQKNIFAKFQPYQIWWPTIES